MSEPLASLNASLERLGERVAAAMSLMESSAARLEQLGASQTGEVGKITASVESSTREAELEHRLEEAERELSTLRASAAAPARKTLASATVQLLAKQGIDAGEAMDVRALDAALEGMSVEQRIAVKSQMLRAGTLTL